MPCDSGSVEVLCVECLSRRGLDKGIWSFTQVRVGRGPVGECIGGIEFHGIRRTQRWPLVRCIFRESIGSHRWLCAEFASSARHAAMELGSRRSTAQCLTLRIRIRAKSQQDQ